MEQQWYRFREVSEILGVAPDTLRTWRRKGKLVVFKIGRGVRIPRSEIVRLTSQVSLGHRGNSK